jgi:cytidylate kinase
MIIAIDGPAGSGKSTIARKVAEALGFVYVNSGNIYRAITLGSLNHGIGLSEKDRLLAWARGASIEYQGKELHLEGHNVDAELHSSRVDALVAQLSAIPEIRDVVNAHVKRIAHGTDAVVEGRDMTTVVFPDADYKFFLDASVESRAQRRFHQGCSDEPLDEIRKNIEMRDNIDRNKSVGALKIAAEAFYLDSSDLTIDQVYDKVYGKILH